MRSPDELFASHTRLAFWISRDYFIPGAERADVDQEALAALYEAATLYDPAEGPFLAFAGVVVRRHLMDCVTTARRGKRAILANSVRVVVDHDGEEVDAIDEIVAPRTVEDDVLVSAELADILRAARALTPLERSALGHAVDGRFYSGDKSIDNALQRARRKLKAAA